MVSYRVAKIDKHHSIVDDLILPAATDMAGTMVGEKAQKTIDNTFIKQQFHGGLEGRHVRLTCRTNPAYKTHSHHRPLLSLRARGLTLYPGMRLGLAALK